MSIDFSGDELVVDGEEESTFCSKHTGRPLRRIKIGLIAQTLQAHRSLLLKIRRAEHDGISSADDQGHVTGKWKITNSTFAARATSIILEYYHEILMEELEEPGNRRLLIDDLILRPYFYEEEFDCDDLSVKSRVMVSPDQDARLRMIMKDDGYFSVVRRGINEEPREMRFSNTDPVVQAR